MTHAGANGARDTEVTLQSFWRVFFFPAGSSDTFRGKVEKTAKSGAGDKTCLEEINEVSGSDRKTSCRERV